MKRSLAGEDCRQATLLPDYLDDDVAAENPVRLVEAFVDELDLAAPGLVGTLPETIGRPAYHSSTLLKIDLYGYSEGLSGHLWHTVQGFAIIEIYAAYSPDDQALATRTIDGFLQAISARSRSSFPTQGEEKPLMTKG